MEENKIVKIGQAAQELGVSKYTVRKLIRQGLLVGRRTTLFGRTNYVTLESIKHFLTEGTSNARG